MPLRRRDLLFIGCGLAVGGVVAALRVHSWSRRAMHLPWFRAEDEDVMGDDDLVGGAIRVAATEGLGFLDCDGTPHGLSESVIDALRLPNGASLTPTMKRWLAFDARAVGWFDDLANPVFRRQDVLAFARSTLQPAAADGFEGLAKNAMPGFCLGVPLGDESRRFVYLSEPDATGEYPVMLIDVDDMPFVCVGYPGLDVYLATHAGLLPEPGEDGDAKADPRFAARMKHHEAVVLGGRDVIEMYEPGFPGPGDPHRDRPEARHGARSMIGENEPVPPGYLVVETVKGPFGRTLRVIERER
jgi:hypothetical protein